MMAGYLIRRLIQSALILLGVSFITFVLLFVLPADPVRQIAVCSGVHPVQACADDSDGDQRRGVWGSALQCAFMGGAVNAQGQSRDHRQT